jgi:hypothetical protein
VATADAYAGGAWTFSSETHSDDAPAVKAHALFDVISPTDENWPCTVVGTSAPSVWISPGTYEIAIGGCGALRPDPQYVDPYPLTVIYEAEQSLIQITVRVQERGENPLDLPLSSKPLVGHDFALTRAGIVERIGLDEAGDLVTRGMLAAPTELLTPPRSEMETMGVTPVEGQRDPAPPVSESAAAAREIRALSGLTAEQLGDLFPVSRESFQRWLTGTPPNQVNLARLMALRHFLRALSDRVDDPRAWLYAPLGVGPDAITPYDLLRRGQLTTLWEVLADRRSAAKRIAFTDAEGGPGTRLTGALRSKDTRTLEEELDDYDDWFGDDAD